MTPRSHDIETSELIVLEGDDGNNSYRDVWAVFDVSPTVEQRFVAIHWSQLPHPNEGSCLHEILITFDGIDELMRWCVYRQEYQKAVFRGGTQTQYNDFEWLDKTAHNLGYEDGWDQFVAEHIPYVKQKGSL